jgi:ribosomal protein S18 acetylase RimI-like enzyme
LLSLKLDNWDTSFFGSRIARLNLCRKRKTAGLSRELSDLVDRAREKKVRFLVAKLNSPAHLYEKKMTKAGFARCGESVDLVYRYTKRKEGKPSGDVKVRSFAPKDARAVRDIASDAFRLSYLYKCGFAGKEKIDRYHVEWVNNLIKGSSSRVFVAEKGRKVVGFSAINVDRDKGSGRIILIAVHKKFRGLGIGNALTRKCIEWGRGRLGKMFVKTQKDNRKALLLYKKHGFTPRGHEKIFCKRVS